MNYFNKTICVLAIILLQACISYKTSIRQDINYVNSWKKTPTVSILAPDVSISFYDANRGNLRLKDTETNIHNLLLQRVSEIMRVKGYTAYTAEFTAKDPDVKQIKSAYKSISKDKLYNHRNLPLYAKESVAFSTDEYVNRKSIESLSGKTKANLIMIVKYSGVHNLASRIAQNYDTDKLFNNNIVTYPTYGSTNKRASGILEIALLEKSTGKLFWSNRVQTSFDFLSQRIEDPFSPVFGFGLDELPTKRR